MVYKGADSKLDSARDCIVLPSIKDIGNNELSSPIYSPPQSHQEKLPHYRAAHGFANSTEELAALKGSAGWKRNINPGKDGSRPEIALGVRWVAAVQLRDQAKEKSR